MSLGWGGWKSAVQSVASTIAQLAGQSVSMLKLTLTQVTGQVALQMTDGARLKLGGGTTDYLTSDGATTITAAGTMASGAGWSSPGFSVGVGGGVTCGQITNTGLIVSASASLQELTGQVADGAAAVAVAISPFATYSNATAKLVSFRDGRGGTEKLAIRPSGKLLYPTGTADAVAGVATLVAGTVTVATTSVLAASVILHARKATGGTAGFLSIANIVAGTSFDIISANGADTSTVSWMLVN